jgi:hypothetical protein
MQALHALQALWVLLGSFLGRIFNKCMQIGVLTTLVDLGFTPCIQLDRVPIPRLRKLLQPHNRDGSAGGREWLEWQTIAPPPEMHHTRTQTPHTLCARRAPAGLPALLAAAAHGLCVPNPNLRHKVCRGAPPPGPSRPKLFGGPPPTPAALSAQTVPGARTHLPGPSRPGGPHPTPLRPPQACPPCWRPRRTAPHSVALPAAGCMSNRGFQGNKT